MIETFDNEMVFVSEFPKTEYDAVDKNIEIFKIIRLYKNALSSSISTMIFMNMS